MPPETKITKLSSGARRQAAPGPFDVAWGRPVFRAPPLLSPRLILDLPAFRSPVPARRGFAAAAREQLDAA